MGSRAGITAVGMGSRAGIAAVGLAVLIATAACGADRVTITPTAGPPASPPAVIHSLPSCDGSVVITPWADFAAAFNAGRADQAAAHFGGGHDFVWWDPSDPSGHVQVLDDLPAHFTQLHTLGVRLPLEIQPMPPDGQKAGEGGFVFDDHQGFAGEGSVICQTAKISFLVIDTWNRQIAGRAPVGPPLPSPSP